MEALNPRRVLKRSVEKLFSAASKITGYSKRKSEREKLRHKLGEELKRVNQELERVNRELEELDQGKEERRKKAQTFLAQFGGLSADETPPDPDKSKLGKNNTATSQPE